MDPALKLSVWQSILDDIITFFITAYKGKSRDKIEAVKTAKKNMGSFFPLFQIMMKLSLNNAQNVREHSSALFDLVIIDSTCEPIIAMKDAGRQYALACRKAGKDHTYGPPFLHLFNALLTSLCTLANKIGQANHGKISPYAEIFGDFETNEACDILKTCKLDRAFSSSVVKLYLCFPSCPIRKEVLAALEQLGGKRKFGRAPIGAMESELQSWLEAFSSD